MVNGSIGTGLRRDSLVFVESNVESSDVVVGVFVFSRRISSLPRDKRFLFLSFVDRPLLMPFLGFFVPLLVGVCVLSAAGSVVRLHFLQT